MTNSNIPDTPVQDALFKTLPGVEKPGNPFSMLLTFLWAITIGPIILFFDIFSSSPGGNGGPNKNNSLEIP